MRRRVLPALDDVTGELSRGKTATVEIEGQIFGDEAVAIALRLGPLVRLAPVGRMREFPGSAQIVRKRARRRGQRRVGLQRAQLVLFAKGVRQLDDGQFGLGQVGKDGHHKVSGAEAAAGRAAVRVALR